MAMALQPLTQLPDANLPSTYWNQLTTDDKAEFIRLRTQFHHGQKVSSKDRRIVTFRNELLVVLKFLERTPENMEARCVLTGICFVGPAICVNTRQLKTFLSRCKSSINGSFQQLGYVACRTKSKARACITAALPSLQEQQNILRQWTVRVASLESQFCFVSAFPASLLPEIVDEDLFDDHKNNSQAGPVFSHSQPMRTPSAPVKAPPPAPVPFKPRFIQFDLQSISDVEPESDDQLPTATMSLSMDFHDIEQGWDDDISINDTSFQSMNQMSRSVSAPFTMNNGWDLFDGLI